MSNRKIKFAIFGAGNITGSRHIPTLRALGRAEILGIVDINSSRAEAAARRFNLPHWSAGCDQPWFDDVEAVTIGVSPHAHAAAARRALEAGKHVLLEKPMTLQVADAEMLVELAAARRRILAVVHNFQFARSAMKLKRMIAAGKLGEVRGILAFQTSTTQRRLPVWHEELPLGLFYDEAPHLVYLLKAFGGPVAVQSVAVTPSTQGRVTPAVITAHLTAGPVPAVLYNNFEAPVSEWHFTVFGTKAAGIIDVFRDVLVVLPNDGQHLSLEVMRTTWSAVGWHLWGVFTSGLAMLRGRLLYGNEEVFRRFLDAVETGQAPADINGSDGLAVVRSLHQILDLAAQPVG